MSVKPRNTTGKGYYQVRGAEPLAKKPIALRLPETVDQEVRQLAGEDLTGWLRRAIAAQVEIEKAQKATSREAIAQRLEQEKKSAP